MGDSVDATVYVVDAGMLSDADSLRVMLSSGTYPSWSEPLGVTRIATGTYRATFRILANMTDLFLPGIGLGAEASIGSLTDRASLLVPVPGQYDLSVDVTLSKYSAVPGETVTGTVRVSLNGTLSDADLMNVSARSELPGQLEQIQYLAVANVSTGTYSFSYAIPASTSQTTMIVFWADATVVRPSNTMGFLSTVPLRVEVTDHFLVWYHQVAFTADYADLEIWVADPYGVPVADADVTLKAIACYLCPGAGVRSLGNATDVHGRAPFNMTLNFTGTPGGLAFWGSVAKGSANESYTGVLLAPPTRNPPYIGFEVRRNNVLDNFRSGQTATLNYTALSEGTPLAQKVIYYAVYNLTALAGYGSVVTDVSGGFGLQFIMPGVTAWIDFSLEIEPNVWSSAQEYLWSAQPLAAEMGAFEVGGLTRVTAQLPAGGAPWAVTARLYPHNLSEYPLLRPDWSPVTESTSLFYPPGLRVLDASTLDLTLPLPRFLPADRSYLLEIWVYSMNLNGPAGIALEPYVLTKLVYVSAALPGTPDPMLFAILGALAAIAAVAVSVFLLLRRRVSTQPAKPPDAAPPSEGAQSPPRPPLQP